MHGAVQRNIATVITAPSSYYGLAPLTTTLSPLFQRARSTRATYQVVRAVHTPVTMGAKLEDLNITNKFVESFPGDPIQTNSTRQVTGALWSSVEPTPTGGEAKVVAYSKDVCKLLGLDPSEGERPEFALIFSGAAPLPGGKPYAQCYGGHQFGNWAGQLGDGRAISIGEVVAAGGQRWELQLKGAGPTPYSRHSDGRAVLRSSIREYVASEAFEHLGIPTTRALSLVRTGVEVARDMFYNGNVKMEPGAIVCRVSPSFIRFGTFQLPASRGDKALVRNVADFTIANHYQHLEGDSKHYVKLLQEVVSRTADLVVKWQLVGFVHGVLNTDNMSILGLTIDYGPYGFLDTFDPVWTPNLTDANGRRYCYKAQLEVVQWNLAQLATALVLAELVDKDAAQEAVNAYGPMVMKLYEKGMARKLGLEEENDNVVNELLLLMYNSKADFTNTFRTLSSVPVDGAAFLPDTLKACCGKDLSSEAVEEWQAWLENWRSALRSQKLSEQERIELQNSVNPVYVPRQHLLQYAINDAEAGDYAELHRLMAVLEHPYEEQVGMEKYRLTPPAEMQRPGISMLSCSS